MRRPKSSLEVCVTPRCYTEPVPTKHPRIAITGDPEVQRALDQTRDLLDPDETRSLAAQARALIIRGADALAAGAGPARAQQRRLAERHGIAPAGKRLAELDPPEGSVDPNGATPASDALDWVRGG